jgi:predicted dehydrogenase
MTVRIGFIGTGFMGQLAHLYNFHQVPECRVEALAEVRRELARKVAREYSIPTVYDSHEGLLADTSVDAVILSQPFHRNYYLGREVLKAGKHLFTEKPMAGTYNNAKELADLAKEKSLLYTVGFMKRYDTGIQLAQRLIKELEESEELGELKMVDTNCFLGDWLQNPGRPINTNEPFPADGLEPQYPEFLAPEMFSVYSNFLNIYSHNINLLHFLLSERKIECESSHAIGDSFIVALRSKDILISLRGTYSRNNKWQEHTSLYFEKGRIEIESASPMNRQSTAQVSLWRDRKGVWNEERLFAPIEWAFYRQALAFVESITEGTDSLTSADKCLADVALMEDIFRKLK